MKGKVGNSPVSNSTQNPFLLKRKKLDAKYLKMCIKFVVFYSLPKKIMFDKISFKTTDKKKRKS